MIIVPIGQMRHGGSEKSSALPVEAEREGGGAGQGTQRVGLQVQLCNLHSTHPPT